LQEKNKNRVAQSKGIDDMGLTDSIASTDSKGLGRSSKDDYSSNSLQNLADASKMAKNLDDFSEAKTSNGATLLSVLTTPDFMLLPLELQGFCPWTLVHARGLLVPGLSCSFSRDSFQLI
jgi:hypothetical protein